MTCQCAINMVDQLCPKMGIYTLKREQFLIQLGKRLIKADKQTPNSDNQFHSSLETATLVQPPLQF